MRLRECSVVRRSCSRYPAQHPSDAARSQYQPATVLSLSADPHSASTHLLIHGSQLASGGTRRAVCCCRSPTSLCCRRRRRCSTATPAGPRFVACCVAHQACGQPALSSHMHWRASQNECRMQTQAHAPDAAPTSELELHSCRAASAALGGARLLVIPACFDRWA